MKEGTNEFYARQKLSTNTHQTQLQNISLAWLTGCNDMRDSSQRTMLRFPLINNRRPTDRLWLAYDAFYMPCNHWFSACTCVWQRQLNGQYKHTLAMCDRHDHVSSAFVFLLLHLLLLPVVLCVCVSAFIGYLVCCPFIGARANERSDREKQKRLCRVHSMMVNLQHCSEWNWMEYTHNRCE